MTQPSSLPLDLQCSGVTPAPTLTSPRPKACLSDIAVKEKLGACLSREPLQDSNTQPSPGGSSSQKRSNTTSESIDVTPSEKRPPTLPLSPKRPIGQQFNTLEIQRVLSLTPGKKPEFRHSLTQQSIQSGHAACSHSSPGSTAQANTSPASHKTSDSTRQQTASPQLDPHEESADAPHMLHDTCPATEQQLAGVPATQPVCAASALDLIMQATQVVMTDADACQPKLAVHSAQHQSGPVLGCQHASGGDSTPMLQIAALQDTADIPHSRVPAGPVASPPLSQHGSKEAEQAGGSLTSLASSNRAADGNQPAGEAHPKPALEETGVTAKADLMLPGASAEALLASAEAGTCNQSGRQQPQLQSRCLPEPAVTVPPGTAPSLDPSSLAADVDTEDANLSQVGVACAFHYLAIAACGISRQHCFSNDRRCCKGWVCCLVCDYVFIVSIHSSMPSKHQLPGTLSGMSYSCPV